MDILGTLTQTVNLCNLISNRQPKLTYLACAAQVCNKRLWLAHTPHTVGELSVLFSPPASWCFFFVRQISWAFGSQGMRQVSLVEVLQSCCNSAKTRSSLVCPFRSTCNSQSVQETALKTLTPSSPLLRRTTFPPIMLQFSQDP